MAGLDILRDCRKSGFDNPDHLCVFVICEILPF